MTGCISEWGAGCAGAREMTVRQNLIPSDVQAPTHPFVDTYLDILYIILYKCISKAIYISRKPKYLIIKDGENII
jgi:hypothetical protein